MVSTASPAKASAAGGAPTVEAARATDAVRVATADLRAERRTRLPSPWTPDEPFSGDARGDDDAAGKDSVPSEDARTQHAARVLRATAELCGAPLSVSIAALVYLVVFYERPEHTHAADAPKDVVPACLLLASKIEEKPTRVSDVVNAMQRVLHPLRRDPPFLRAECARRRETEPSGKTPRATATDPEPEPERPNPSTTESVDGPSTTTVAAPAGAEASAKTSRASAVTTEAGARGDAPRDAREKNASDASPRPSNDRDAPYSEEACRARYLRREIEQLKKKHPHNGPKSLYASAMARWRDAPENPASDAAKKARANARARDAAEDADLRLRTERVPRGEADAETPVVDGSRLQTSLLAASSRERSGGATNARAAARPRPETGGASVAAADVSAEPPPRARDEDDPNFRLSRPVIGEAYYETKARVLRAEQLVLRAVDAEVNVTRVLNVLLNLARRLNAPKEVAKLAFVALTDVLFETSSDTRLARGLFFGAEAVGASAAPAVAGLASGGHQTEASGAPAATARATRRRSAPLELAGDASAASVRVAARLCGYALVRDARGGGVRWTRARDVSFPLSADEREGGGGARPEEETRLEEETRRARKKARFSGDETRLDTRRGEGFSDAGDADGGDASLADPWWVEMEFDHARVERIERDMLRVLVKGAASSRTR